MFPSGCAVFKVQNEVRFRSALSALLSLCFLRFPAVFFILLQFSVSRSLKTIQFKVDRQSFRPLCYRFVDFSALRLLTVFRLPTDLLDFSRSSVSTWNERSDFSSRSLPRKEVIQPHLPIRLPCYDFTPVIGLTFDGWLLSVTSPASGAPNSHGVTGGVYKARERIHRGMLIRDY